MKKTTIKDLARELDISVGTVHRALSNKGRIKAETKQSVIAKAKELNYQANSIAQKFAFRNSCRILVVMPKEPAYYWDDIRLGLSAIEHELSEFGAEINIFLLHDEKNQNTTHLDIIKILEEKKVDGLVIVPLFIDGFIELTKYVKANAIPMIIFNSELEYCDKLLYYGPDDETSGRMAGELISKFIGAKGDVCVIVQSQTRSFYAQRLKGFFDHIHNHCPFINISDIYTYENGQEKEMLTNTLKNHPGIKGIYVVDGVEAGIFGKVLKEMKMDKMVLIGHESNPLTKEMLMENYITALLCEKKFCQGYFPVKLIYEYLVQGTLPKETKIFTDINIVLKENEHYLEYYQEGRGYR